MEDEVVISGIGCKLPESDSMEEFAEKLFSGLNLVTRDDRKLSQGLFENLPEFSGKVRGTRKFDYTFFGISNIVVQCMDPMTQHIMERTFEAVMDAGINPCELRGTNTAVWSGTSISDFDLEWATNYRGGYGIMGRNRCMNANRVSYWLDLKGTSVSLDSTWTNGISNLLNGWEAIKMGRCDTALISTANLQSNAEIAIQLNDLGVLSPNGVCKSFDDSADGYARSDAVVVLVLQRASIARRSYATICHVFSRCFGDRDNIIHKPLQEHWETTFEEFYSQSKINVNDICYVEGHGTGVKDEDAVELNAISNFFCRDRKGPLLVGSVKSSMGHAESAAASCSLVKAVICLEKGIVPGNLHFSTPNASCPGFQGGKIKVVDANTPLPEDGLIAVNAHGFGGVFAHIVLKRNPKPKSTEWDGIPRLVLVADRTNDMMDSVLNKIESMPFDLEYVSLLNEINSKKVDKYLGRGYTILPKKEGAALREHQVFNETKRPVWFVFSGMGSQWAGMGRRLMALPLFRESIERSHKVLESRGLNLISIITENDPTIFENILHSFVGIAAIQIALVDILTALGIVPDGMIGHSVGELGCAYADGCFTAEQMILSAYSRGMASIESNLIRGFMAAVGKGYREIKDELPEGIEVACHNASDSCTISGPAEKVQEYVKELESRGIFAKTVNVSNIAYHSRYIRPAAPRLLKYLQEVIPEPKPRSSRWISTSNLEENWGTELAKHCSAEYHTNNLLSSVLFEEGCRHIPTNAICIEIAPHGLLQAILKRSLSENCFNISLTRRTADDPLNYLLQAIGKLYMAGLQPQISRIYPGVEYPVSRATPSIHQLIHWDHEVDLTMAQTRAEKKVIYSFKAHFLKTAVDGVGYVINGDNTYPVAVFLHLVWSIFASLRKRKTEECPVAFENIRVERSMIVHPSKNDDGMVTLQKGTGDFEINTSHLIARGNIALLPDAAVVADAGVDFEGGHEMNREEIYGEFQGKGNDVGDCFKSLTSARIGKQGWRAEVEDGANWVQTMEAVFQVPSLALGDETESALFPQSFERMWIVPQQHLKLKASQKLSVAYDAVQNVVTCGGITMKGFKARELPAPKSTLKFTSRQFAPFMYPPFKDPWRFVDFCFGIVLDGKDSAEEEVTVLEVVAKHSEATPIVAHLEEAFPHVKVRGLRAASSGKALDLVVCSTADVPSLAADANFILTRTSTNLEGDYDVVSKFALSGGEEMRLLKKRCDLGEPEVVVLPKNEGMVINTLHGLAGGRPAILVCCHEPERGLESFKRRMQAEARVPLRWIFVLDEDAAPLSKEDVLSLVHVRAGLATCVLRGGAWGCFLQMNHVRKGRDAADFFNVSKIRKELTECFIGFGVSDNFPEATKEVEISGRTKSTAIMALCSVDSDASIVRDEHLTWTLPEGWSLEDGASAPLSYALAYHSMVVVGRLRPFEGVLVTDACTPLGMAATAVGLSIAERVYVTVGNDDEASAIRTRFPSIPRENILCHDDQNFHVALGLVTKGAYVEMIVSQLEGERLLSTVTCLTAYGRMFHFGKEDYKKNVQLGTSIFLASTSFHSQGVGGVLALREEEKKRVRELVEGGISKGVVRPLPRKLVTAKEFQKMVAAGSNREKVVLGVECIGSVANGLVVDGDKSYLVVGDESEAWVDVLRWLMRRGARKVVVVHGGGGERRIKRYNRLIERHGGVVVARSVRDAVRTAPSLAAVFLIAMGGTSATRLAAEVDEVYREGFLLAVTKGDAAVTEVCAVRSRSGLPSTNFVWAAEEFLVGREMDLMVKLCGKDPVIHVSHAQKGGMDVDGTESILREILPASIEDFCRLGASLSEGVDVKELPSAAGIVPEQKELTPLIFVCGLQSDPVDALLTLAKGMMYPTYCVTLPHWKMSIQSLASFILPRIMMLTKDAAVPDSFNIIGVSWGCYVAIEIAKQIEKMDKNVGLILVDCPNQSLRQSLRATRSWESDLLNAIHGAAKTVDVSDDAALDRTWSAKVNRIATSLRLTQEDEADFRKAVNFIRNSLAGLVDYEVAGTKLRGPLTIVRSGKNFVEDRTLSKMCNCISVRQVPAAGRELLASRELREIILGSAVAQTMSKSTANMCSWRNLEDFLIQQKISDFNSLTADFRVTATKLKFSFTH